MMVFDVVFPPPLIREGSCQQVEELSQRRRDFTGIQREWRGEENEPLRRQALVLHDAPVADGFLSTLNNLHSFSTERHNG